MFFGSLFVVDEVTLGFAASAGLMALMPVAHMRLPRTAIIATMGIGLFLVLTAETLGFLWGVWIVLVFVDGYSGHPLRAIGVSVALSAIIGVGPPYFSPDYDWFTFWTSLLFLLVASVAGWKLGVAQEENSRLRSRSEESISGLVRLLHDSVAAELSHATGRTQILIMERNTDQELVSELQAIDQSIREASNQIRGAISALSSGRELVNTEFEDLQTAFSHSVDFLEQQGYSVDWQVELDDVVPMHGIDSVISAAMKEASVNISKYGSPAVPVRLAVMSGNGISFEAINKIGDERDRWDSSRLGLKLLTQAVESYGGSAQFSEIDGYWHFSVAIPEP